jgi:hypothetical protein
LETYHPSAQPSLRVELEPEEDGDHASGRLRKPKKEPALATSLDAGEDAILEAVLARSKNDVVPADLQMPLDVELAWSKAEWEKEEDERQQRLLEEVALRRARYVVILDDNDDDGGASSLSP